MSGKRRECVPAFMNRVNPDLLLRTLERVQAMRLERLTGERYEVRASLSPRYETDSGTNADGHEKGGMIYV